MRQPGAPLSWDVAAYTLKLYRRQDPHSSPGALIGRYDFSAAGNAEAIEHATAAYATALADCDHAVIGGLHGRIVWEKGWPVGAKPRTPG